MEYTNPLKTKSIGFVNKKSQNIFKSREFALIGMSPFNGYFTLLNIFSILNWAFLNFKSFKVFLPDQISYYTLKALRYDEKHIKYKVRKQDNYLKNKINRAIQLLEIKYGVKLTEVIVKISDLKFKSRFQEILVDNQYLFNTNSNFKKSCLETSDWAITTYKQAHNIVITEEGLTIAANYFLHELPLLLNAPEILDTNSCLFVYHSTPKFIEELYNNTDLVASNQGYMNVLLDIESEAPEIIPSSELGI